MGWHLERLDFSVLKNLFRIYREMETLVPFALSDSHHKAIVGKFFSIHLVIESFKLLISKDNYIHEKS